MIQLAENTYGKCRVRVVRVKRDEPMHRFQEWAVEVLLTGDFAECFTDGDNSRILATDTMKNIVYSLARDTTADSIEGFALELTAYLLGSNLQVDEAKVSVTSVPWAHINVGGATFPSAFMQSSNELQTAKVSCAQAGIPSIRSGLDNLVIMKTASSKFEGFLRDSHTTLPETVDRLLGTAVRAQWKYTSPAVAFEMARASIRDTLLSVFAEHDSKSVQHTLYAMGKTALENVVEIEDIEIVMPNRHCLLVDLSRFGKTNPNAIFVPTDEPYGYIEARLCRQS
jgi:urate oxidase